ncbi:MAG: hypothetical protein IJE07_04680 [Clostridia bacterium]|nr:hypothetical protein [Clostridia bacterium]
MQYLISLFRGMSDMRCRYALRLVGRCLVLLVAVMFCIYDPTQFSVLQGMNFFRGLSWLHALWLIWVIDMAAQILPLRTRIALGSQKLWSMRFTPIREVFNASGKLAADGVAKLKKHILDTTRSALWVLILWTALVAVIGVLAAMGVMTDVALFMAAVIFYVCDLICVLIWCPFRLIMRNKCCTTCRIFNWDHLMMFSPFLFLKGFFSWSLLAMAIVAWLVWEIAILLHPERFWEGANAALTCAACTDKLCTQYCRKLRPARAETKQKA